jgi:hypothetical protein
MTPQPDTDNTPRAWHPTAKMTPVCDDKRVLATIPSRSAPCPLRFRCPNLATALRECPLGRPRLD